MESYYDKYKVNVPTGEIGPYKVERFEVSKDAADLYSLQQMFSGSGAVGRVPAGTYTRLVRGNTLVMSDTPSEIRDHLPATRRARGRCLINGLGIGMVLQAFLKKPEVEHVTVIEKAPEVIELVGRHYLGRYGSERLTIIEADAYAYKPPRGEKYDTVWHDIWDDICTDNLPLMTKLHRKYGRRTVWQGSWKKEFLKRYKRQENRRGWW
jgi:hypothetical protein